jgi:hypothetical protein
MENVTYVTYPALVCRLLRRPPYPHTQRPRGVEHTPTIPRVTRPRREPFQPVYTPYVARVRNDPDRLTSELCRIRNLPQDPRDATQKKNDVQTRATRHKKKRRTDPRDATQRIDVHH